MVDESDRDGLSLTHLDLYRVVTYPLSRIERLLRRAGCDPTAWAQVHEGSDEWTRKRISQTLCENMLLNMLRTLDLFVS